METKNQIIQFNKSLTGIDPFDFFRFEKDYVSDILNIMAGLKARNFNDREADAIKLLQEIEGINFSLSRTLEICKELSELIITYQNEVVHKNKLPDLSQVILKLNKLHEIRNKFKEKENELGGVASNLLELINSLPERERGGQGGDWTSDWYERLSEKKEDFREASGFRDKSYNVLSVILSNSENLIEAMIRLEGFTGLTEEEGDEEDEPEEGTPEFYRKREHSLATTKLYILLNELNLAPENVNGFIKYLISYKKYPKDGNLYGWEPGLLKLANKKYNLNNFSFDELFKLAVGDVDFLEMKFKEDIEIMKYLREKILNKFIGYDGDKTSKVDLEDVLYFLKEKTNYLSEDLRKVLYKYAMNNFETNNFLRLLKMFDNNTFVKFLNFYHNYIKKIDTNLLVTGKFYKFYEILNVADKKNYEFSPILAAIKALGANSDEKLLGMINRGFMILATLHNNNYGMPKANSMTYDFVSDDFLKDLFLSMMSSKWDFKQDVTDKFINIGLNSKIDKMINVTGSDAKFIADKFGINLDRFRNDLMEIRRIISNGAEIPFSWREKIYKIDNNLNMLLSGEILLNYTNEVNPKEKQLFNLNYEMNDGLRFEVLPDMSLEHFKVGAATQSCQRAGGAAETSMIDSFINGLAGVLVLKRNSEIISQSYFHYVPEDNGYILDNVEANIRLVKKYGINLDNLYANLAKRIKEDWGISYFKCGRNYNKLEDDLFELGRLENDPRYFELEKSEDIKVYSDFDEKDHLDLTNPKFPIIPIDMKIKVANKFDKILKISEFFKVMVKFSYNKLSRT